jgi:hypothetical protein
LKLQRRDHFILLIQKLFIKEKITEPKEEENKND